MKKKVVTSHRVIGCLIFLCSFSLQGFAQTDSLSVVKAKWNSKKIARGVWLKHYWFEHSLFASSQNINILEVKQNGKNKLDVAAEPKVRKLTSDFGTEQSALAGINGTFFDMKNGGSEDYIRIDGAELNGNILPKNTRAQHQKAAVVIDGKKVRIEQWDGSANWEANLPGEDIMVSGPLLLKSKQRSFLDTANKFNTARHPRTAVALKGNRLLLITVDGRNEKAAGMSLFELANFLKWMKAEDAVNLDGGGSTTMWIRGFADGGIVNHPSDNPQMEKAKNFKAGMDLDNFPASEKWDRAGERTVANVLLVNKKK